MVPVPSSLSSSSRAATSALVVALLFATAPAWADDWPQWRGPDRQAVWAESGILERFPETGLPIKWKTTIHGGYSGPSVADGRVFITDFRRDPESTQLEGTERVLALDEETGEILWSHEWPVSYAVLMGTYAIGPRATPTVDGDRVFVIGAVGHLLSLKVDTGQVLWKKDLVKEYGTQIPIWGSTSSPLVDGDRLIAIAGAQPDGRVMAFDKTSGKEVWRALSSDWEMGYGQPLIAEAGGARQLIIWQPQGVSSLDPLNGKLYWEVPWEVRSGLTVATPVLDGSRLFLTQFYGGSLMIELAADKPGARELWRAKGGSEMPNQTAALHALITTPILDGETIYGVCSYGETRALDAGSGKRLWMSDKLTRQGRWGSAFLVRNGDRYFVNNDLGELIIAKFTRQGYVEVDRTLLIEPTSSSAPRRRADSVVNWSHPAYANRHVFARNDKEILCASLAK